MTTESIDSQSGGNRTTLLLYWGAFVIVCALVDFACGLMVVGLFSDLIYVVYFLLAGAMRSQIAIHALWTVFAPVSSLKKLTISIVTAFVWAGAFLLGVCSRIINDFGIDLFEDLVEFRNEIAAVLLLLPLVPIIGYAPLWVARYFFRWKVVHSADPEASKLSSPLQIRHMMIATGVVAVALSACKLADHFIGDDYVLLMTSSILLSVAGLCLFTLLPMTAVILRMRRPFLGLLILLAIHAGFNVFWYLALRLYFGVPFEAKTLLYSFGYHAIYLGLLGGSLFGVRALGYRLQWGRGTKLDSQLPHRNAVELPDPTPAPIPGNDH